MQHCILSEAAFRTWFFERIRQLTGWRNWKIPKHSYSLLGQ